MNMEITLSSILVSVFLVVIVLLVLGGIVAWIYSTTRKPAAKKSPAGQRSELVELFKLHRDRITKQLALEAGGKLFKNRSDLTVNQVDQLSILLGELLSWLGKPELTRRSVEAVTGINTPAGEGLVVPNLDLRGSEAKANSFLRDPAGMLVKAVAADVPRSPSESRSIATQVDEILQDRLRDSALAGRQVRLIDQPEKGLSVLVGNDEYSSIEEIPEPEIQALIRKSVSEWEAQAKR